MNTSLVATLSIEIAATPEKIWEVLTQPELIKVYLFGTNVTTDWQEGSTISFNGEYQGHEYHDKGNVLQKRPHELLKYNYWSGFSGLEDKLENYSIVTYTVQNNGNGTCQFTWHQQGFASEEGKCHTEAGLKPILQQIKELAEK